MKHILLSCLLLLALCATALAAPVEKQTFRVVAPEGWTVTAVPDVSEGVVLVAPDKSVSVTIVTAASGTMTPEQRGKFVEAMFTVLSASGAATLTDLKADSFKAVGAMVRAMKDLDKETRDGLLKFMGLLFRSNLLLTLEGIQEESGKRGFRWGRKKRRPEEEEA